ncbi:MAG: hypothetical protein AMS19_10825 [Gemmatimonas sp. SG8_23]|nr:MAG: hypothetical protein AMS19_10825 [Gemmatimonas sp. SG8_23]
MFEFLFGAGFALLAVAAGVTIHLRRRDAYARVPVVDDAVIEQIIERGEIYVEDDEPLDLDVIEDEEERFWSESWDEPSGDW